MPALSTIIRDYFMSHGLHTAKAPFERLDKQHIGAGKVYLELYRNNAVAGAGLNAAQGIYSGFIEIESESGYTRYCLTTTTGKFARLPPAVTMDEFNAYRTKNMDAWTALEAMTGLYLNEPPRGRGKPALQLGGSLSVVSSTVRRMI